MRRARVVLLQLLGSQVMGRLWVRELEPCLFYQPRYTTYAVESDMNLPKPPRNPYVNTVFELGPRPLAQSVGLDLGVPQPPPLLERSDLLILALDPPQVQFVPADDRSLRRLEDLIRGCGCCGESAFDVLRHTQLAQKQIVLQPCNHLQLHLTGFRNLLITRLQVRFLHSAPNPRCIPKTYKIFLNWKAAARRKTKQAHRQRGGPVRMQHS